MASNKYNLITKEEVKELIGEELYKDIAEETILSTKKPLDLIYEYCVIFEKLLSINEEEKAYLYGANLLFSIRSFILKEEIVYSLGVESDRGDLKERILTQSEMLKQLKVKFATESLHLSSSLETFKKGDKSIKNVEATLNSIWKKVKSFTHGWGEKTNEHVKGKRENTYWYRQRDPDKNVYFYFSQNPEEEPENKRVFYYRKEKHYNMGWLYEWTREGYEEAKINDKQTFLLNSLQGDYGLESIIDGNKEYGISSKKMDNKQGLRGGDYLRFYRGKMQNVQAKFGNTKIISFNNIKTSLKNLKQAIEVFRNTTDYSKDKRLVKDIEHIFTEKTKQTINQVGEDRVEELFKILKLKKTK